MDKLSVATTRHLVLLTLTSAGSARNLQDLDDYIEDRPPSNEATRVCAPPEHKKRREELRLSHIWRNRFDVVILVVLIAPRAPWLIYYRLAFLISFSPSSRRKTLRLLSYDELSYLGCNSTCRRVAPV